MKLAFIWVKKYKCLENLGFNLISGHDFEFDIDVATLRHRKTSDFSSKYFDRNGVVDVYSIVGNNGAGKTTFLEMIFNNLCNGEGGIKVELLTIFEEDGIFKLFYSDNPESTESRIPPVRIETDSQELFELDNDGFIVNCIPSCETTNRYSRNKISATNKTDFIYLSNHFDSLYHNYTKCGIRDISVIGLINAIRESQEEYSHTHYYDIIEQFFHDDFERQIRFVTSYENFKDYVPFKIPEKVQVQWNPIEVEPLKKLADDPEISELIDKITSSISNYRSNTEIFKANLYYRILIEVLHYLFLLCAKRKRTIYEQFGKLKEIMLSFDPTHGCDSFLLYIRSIQEYIISQEEARFYDFDFIGDSIEFIILIDSNIHCFKYSPMFSSSFVMNTASDSDNIGIANFFAKYDKITHLNRYLNFTWLLSSGENIILALFARLFSFSKNQREAYHYKSEDNKNELIMLLDEIDFALHPEWQQKILRVLINFVKNIYSNCSNIKIIFTTHSPIILSDMPKSNVIFLYKNMETGISTIQDSKKHKETLGANISTLFYDSFFLHHGSIGDCAKAHINILIKAMCHKENKYPTISEILSDLQLENIEQVYQLIDLVGEPIIRHKLHDMFGLCLNQDNSFQSEIDRKMRHIKRLQKEIEKLQEH